MRRLVDRQPSKPVHPKVPCAQLPLSAGIENLSVWSVMQFEGNTERLNPFTTIQ